MAATPKLSAYPFSLGLASGDPLPDGGVLWTRLAPKPLEAGGGMPSEPIEISWQIAEDQAMRRIIQAGTAVANPSWAHSVHVEWRIDYHTVPFVTKPGAPLNTRANFVIESGGPILQRV